MIVDEMADLFGLPIYDFGTWYEIGFRDTWDRDAFIDLYEELGDGKDDLVPRTNLRYGEFVIMGSEKCGD